MKSSYDFEDQIRYLNDICQTNIIFAQSANTLLPNIPKTVLTKIKQELTQEYQQVYKDDVDTLNSIKNTLNLAAREQLTDIDRLFMDLGFELNTYYEKEHFSLVKSKPFSKVCDHCRHSVSNDKPGLKWHEETCSYNVKNSKILAPQKNIKKKVKDTQQKYEVRQSRKPKNITSTDSKIQIKDNKNLSKRQSLQLKRQTKNKKQKVRQFLEEQFQIKKAQESIYMEEQQDSLQSQVFQPNKVEFKTDQKLLYGIKESQKREKIIRKSNEVEHDDFFD